MNTSNEKRIALALTILILLFVAVISFSTPQMVRAATVCSPATPITSPYAKDGVGDVCLQATTLCNNINSWGLTTLEVNGTSYLNAWVYGPSIPALNGGYTIHYVSTDSNGHFGIEGPCSGATATNTPVGPTATFTRTNTPIPSANILTNADMESGTTNWVVYGSGTLSSDTTQKHGGAKSVKITGRTANWNGVGQNVAVSNFPTSGQNFTVSVWVRSETGTPTANATVRLTASTTTYVQLASAAVNSTGWTQLTGTVPVSWSGTLTGVLFYVETAAGTDNLYIDDASLSGGSAGPTATATPTPTKTATPTRTPTQASGSGVVTTYGRLQISGTSLRDKNGNAIQLAGMSSHGLTWFPLIDLNVNNTTNMNTLKQQITFNPTGGVPFPYTSSAVGNLVTQWHIQVIRTSMFPYDPWNGADAKSYDNNYPTWKWYNINLVNSIVQSAINQNIYVIIDWHAGEGNDQDPNIYWNNGHVQEFFTYMVDKWGSYPNVIYETVNSPVISWAGSPGLKSYNQNVINFIRARETTDGYAANLIIAGTPTWSQDVDVATNDPLTGNLIAYNYMWYAGTHFSWVQSRGETALANLATKAPNQALFMGEVGTSTSDGNGGVYYSNFNTLMEWAKTKKLSWLNWSIANKQESSAIFVPAILGNMLNNEIAWRGGDGGSIAQALASTGYPMRMGPWADADYSCSGKFIKGWILYNTSQSVPPGC
jgi:hypothetical protein